MYFIKCINNNIEKFESDDIDHYILIKSEHDFSKLFKIKDSEFIVGCYDNFLSSDLYCLVKFLVEFKNCRELLFKKMSEYNSNIEIYDNDYIRELVDYFCDLNSDGKYIRGFLILLGYKLMNKDDFLEAVPLALAFEVFQTSVLIHDDIIDKAYVRRGKKTIPSRYSEKYRDSLELGNNLAVCMGDLGFYKSYQLMIENYGDNKRLLKYYNEVIINTIQGEVLDVVLPYMNKNGIFKGEKLEKEIFSVYGLKTAWYSIIGPICMGMILSNASDEEVSLVSNFSYNLGVAYQIKDDILGIFSQNFKNEKTSSDISEFKQTILYSYIYDNCVEYLDELHKYYGRSDLTDFEVNRVVSIFRESGALDYANGVVDHLFEESLEKLKLCSFIKDEYKDILKGFIIYLKNREN